MQDLKSNLMKKNTIADLYAIKDNIDTNPSYQRHGDLWPKWKKQLFIDSILNGFDVPKIYLHKLSTPVISKNVSPINYTIIDGRQRIETIWKFLENDFELGDSIVRYRNQEFNLNGKFYEDLANENIGLRNAIDNYELPIIVVQTHDDDDLELIEEMFTRLNEAVSIKSAEKRNAMGGNMIPIIRKVAGHEFFKDRISFSDLRMQYHEVAARMLFVEKCIGEGELKDTKKDFLDGLVKNYLTTIPPAQYYRKVKEVLDALFEIFDHNDPQLKAQARVLIYYLLTREALEQGKISRITREKINEFNKKIKEHKKLAETDMNMAKFEYLQYDRATIQGTNDAGSIKIRFNVIAKFFGVNTSNIDKL